jgi:hypothetical protein
MPEPERKTGEVRAPVWVVLLVVLGVMIVTSIAVLPMFLGEYLGAVRRSAQSGSGAETGSDSGQNDFFTGGGMQRPYTVEQAFTPSTLNVPAKFSFAAAFVYSAGEGLPFKPEEINSDFVQSQLSLSIDPSVDYLLLFLAGMRFNEYSRDGFPDVMTVLAEVRPEEVVGIIERAKGKFAVFTDPDDIANELGRLRDSKPMLESRP